MIRRQRCGAYIIVPRCAKSTTFDGLVTGLQASISRSTPTSLYLLQYKRASKAGLTGLGLDKQAVHLKEINEYPVFVALARTPD